MTDTKPEYFIDGHKGEVLMIAAYDLKGEIYFPEITSLDNLTLECCANLAGDYSDCGIDAIYKVTLPLYGEPVPPENVTKQIAQVYSETCEYEPAFCDLPDWVQGHIDEAEYNRVRNEPDWRIEAGKEFRGSVL